MKETVLVVFTAVSLFVISFLLFANTFSADFVYDDSRAIVSNADLRPSAPWSVLVTNDFWGTPLTHSGSHKSYRPVCTGTFHLNYLYGELNPYGYHFVNVLLHSVTCFLFWILSLYAFEGNLLVGSFSAFLFAVHPIHSEAVAGIVGRADVLSCCFYLLALLAYIKATGTLILPQCSRTQTHFHYQLPLSTSKSTVITIIWLSLYSVCVALSMFSKELGITIIGVTFICDVLIFSKVPLQAKSIWSIFREPGCKGLLFRLLWNVVTGSLLVAIRLQLISHSPPTFSSSDNPAASSSIWLTRTLTFWFLPSFNFALLLCPLYLSFDWSMDAIPLVEGVGDPRNIASLTFVSFLTFLAIFTLKQLYSASSVSNTVESSLGTDNLNMNTANSNFNLNNRYEFLPVEEGTLRMRPIQGMSSSPLFGDYKTSIVSSHSKPVVHLRQVRVTQYSKDSVSRGRVLLMSLLLLVLPFLPATNLFFYVGFVVAERVLYIPSCGFCLLVAQGLHQVYQKCERRMLEKCLNVICLLLLVLLSWRTYVRNCDWMNEEALYRSGISTNPAKAWGNLGNVLNSKGLTLEAEEAYSNAIKHRPNMADAHYNYGTLLLNKGSYRDAIVRFQDAITYRPKLAAAHLNLGIALSEVKETSKAKQVYSHCSTIRDEGMRNPKSHMSAVTNCNFNLGKIFINEGNFEEALLWLNRARSSAPPGHEMQSIYNLLGKCYATLGNIGEADRYYRMSLTVKPGHIPAVIDYASLLRTQSLAKEALGVLQEGLEYEPNRAEVLLHLGNLYLEDLKDFSAAKVHYKRAVSADPYNVNILLSAANTLRESKHHADAEEYYKTAVERVPESFPAHANYGAFLHLMKKYDKAEYHYKVALQIDPNDQLTKDNMNKLRRVLKTHQ